MTDDKDFVETRASEYLRSLTESTAAVIVFGIGGVGKTTLIQHEALRLARDEEYEIIPITKPSHIAKYHCDKVC